MLANYFKVHTTVATDFPVLMVDDMAGVTSKQMGIDFLEFSPAFLCNHMEPGPKQSVRGWLIFAVTCYVRHKDGFVGLYVGL